MKPETKGLISGFTLIELAIVLVIIGLIIGGVLVGRDLIQAAAVRAQLAQIEKFQTAVNTFYGKYGFLPGDMPSAAATQFGFCTPRGTNGYSDGNGMVAGFAPPYYPTGFTRFGGETALFWNDLSTAKLIEGNYSSLIDGYATITATINPLPSAKIGAGNYIAVVDGSGAPILQYGINYFFVAGITSTDGNHDYVASNAITPLQAFRMDSKIDDGMPQQGRLITAYASAGVHYDSSYSTNNCATSAMQYNITSSNGNAMLCQLAFRFQ